MEPRRHLTALVINGTDGNDTIRGNGATDTPDGGNGNDSIGSADPCDVRIGTP